MNTEELIALCVALAALVRACEHLLRRFWDRKRK